MSRRFAQDAGPPTYEKSETFDVGSSCDFPPPRGTSPYLSSMDSADAPSGSDPPPGAGMRPRDELMFDASKEYYREYRRIVFDFDYWANMRSSTRFIFGILNMPRSFILANVAVPVFILTAWAAAAAALHYGGAGAAIASAAPALAQYFPAKFDDAPIALSASILPLLLVFRTNSAYGRFDEARKMWGLLLNRTRDLVRMAIAFLPVEDQHRKATFARWTIALSIALKSHLRPYDNLKEDMRGLLTAAEMKMFMGADHKARPSLRAPLMMALKAALDVPQQHRGVGPCQPVFVLGAGGVLPASALGAHRQGRHLQDAEAAAQPRAHGVQ